MHGLEQVHGSMVGVGDANVISPEVACWAHVRKIMFQNKSVTIPNLEGLLTGHLMEHLSLVCISSLQPQVAARETFYKKRCGKNAPLQNAQALAISRACLNDN